MLLSMTNQSKRFASFITSKAVRSLFSDKRNKVNTSAGSANVPDIIKEHNYPVEVHDVETDDGYILKLHRIPGKSGSPAILLQHGLMCSSAAWVLAGPNTGLAYLLADQGFDVWMGNSRGNPYSLNHTSTDSRRRDSAFWQFSWHEMGLFDLPAQIDHILERSDQKELFYLGHSQGCTSFFVMAAERPEYNDKIKAMVALSPVAYFKHVGVLPLLKLWSQKTMGLIVGSSPLFSQTSLARRFLNKMSTKDHVISKKLGDGRMLLDMGLDRTRLDETLLPSIFTHYPVSCSVRQVAHYIQLAQSGRFQQFDFGTAANLRVYGSTKPPEYNLANVSCPVIIYYGLSDYLNSKQDADTLYNQLSAPMVCLEVPHPHFKHMDFLWAKDVKSVLYDNIISKLNTITCCTLNEEKFATDEICSSNENGVSPSSPA